jgi:hypothetical protein
MNDDYDSPWKEALEIYFRECLELLFPHAASEIDWSRGYEFLEQELRQVTREAETNRRVVDKLARVWKLDGDEAWVLIHLEVQGQWEADFDVRMYTCNYRIFDLHQRQVATFVVLSDENPNWRPNSFGYELWGSRVQFDFPVAKLMDYNARWDELEASPNPFAVVIMAHLKTQQTRGDEQHRYSWKLRLTRMLYERGFSRTEIVNLYKFIDWLMRLPRELESGYWIEMREYEEEKRMPYVTTAERFGREEGLQQGVQQGVQQTLSRFLSKRFGESAQAILPRLENLSADQLNDLADSAFAANSLDEFIKQLPPATN